MGNMQNLIEEAEGALLHTYNRYQVVLDKGEGVHLYDINGKEYLDFAAGIAVYALGYHYPGFDEALKDVEEGNGGTLPKHLRTDSTEYIYPHDYKGAFVVQQYLPDKLKNKKYYHPKDIGYEKQIKETYEKIERLKQKGNV